MKDRFFNNPRVRHAGCVVSRLGTAGFVAVVGAGCKATEPLNQPTVLAKIEAAPQQYVDPQELVTTVFEATQYPAVVTGEQCDSYQLGYIVMPAPGAVGARRTIRNTNGTDYKPPAELPPGQIEETVVVTETKTLTVAVSQYDESGQSVGNTGGASLYFKCNGNNSNGQ